MTHLRLVSDNGAPIARELGQAVSRDTIRCLKNLLAAAERGEVIGVSYAAHHLDSCYSTHSCGEAYRQPSKALGLVMSLAFQLQKRAHGEA